MIEYKDMRGVSVAVGDVILGTNLSCMDYKIGVVDKLGGGQWVNMGGFKYEVEDCLVLPDSYKED